VSGFFLPRREAPIGRAIELTRSGSCQKVSLMEGFFGLRYPRLQTSFGGLRVERYASDGRVAMLLPFGVLARTVK